MQVNCGHGTSDVGFIFPWVLMGSHIGKRSIGSVVDVSVGVTTGRVVRAPDGVSIYGAAAPMEAQTVLDRATEASRRI